VPKAIYDALEESKRSLEVYIEAGVVFDLYGDNAKHFLKVIEEEGWEFK